LVIDPWLTTNPACSDAWKQVRRANGTVPHVTGTPDQLRALVEPQGVTVLESQLGETAS